MSKYVAGQWNALCDRCGFKYKSKELRAEWTGLRVCHSCFEVRHPQTLIRVAPEHINTPWARPEPADVFVINDQLTIETVVDPNNLLATVLMAEDNSFILTEG